MHKKIEIYTDGSCNGNPGPGGWGVLIKYANVNKELSGFEINTTNNRMELTAAIEGLNILTKAYNVDLYTDSRYLENGMNLWIHNWEKNKWKTSSKHFVKNADLWKKLFNISQKHNISWIWVKSHSGNYGNEKADTLASNAILIHLMSI